MRKKNIPAGAGHHLRREIDSRDFKNKILTMKIRRNKAKKHYFFKNRYSKRF